MDRQQQLAEERTELAYHRTLLAEERTYSAWTRTGLASMASGFAIASLLGESGPPWLIRGVGVLFITTGGAMYAIGFWGYFKAVRKLRPKVVPGISAWIFALLSTALLVGAITALTLFLQTSRS